MSTGSQRSNEPFSAGSAEAARLAREVQNFGFDAARTVVDRFIGLFGHFASTMDDPVGDRSDPSSSGAPVRLRTDSGGYRRLQSDVQRAADSYLAVLGQLNEVALQFLDTSRSDSAASGDTGGLDLPDVTPGGRSSARLWLHNSTSTAVADLRPWIPSLTSHTGMSLPPDAITFLPARVEVLEAEASDQIVVVLAVGEDVLPGTYHGQILIERLPDAVFPLTVRVRLPVSRR